MKLQELYHNNITISYNIIKIGDLKNKNFMKIWICRKKRNRDYSREMRKIVPQAIFACLQFENNLNYNFGKNWS